MPINFPDTPVVNDIFTSGALSFKWNGTAWVSAGAPGASGVTFSTNNRLYGRHSAGSGPGQEIIIGSGLTLTGSTLSASGGGGGGVTGISSFTTLGGNNIFVNATAAADPNLSTNSFTDCTFIGTGALPTDNSHLISNTTYISSNFFYPAGNSNTANYSAALAVTTAEFLSSDYSAMLASGDGAEGSTTVYIPPTLEYTTNSALLGTLGVRAYSTQQAVVMAVRYEGVKDEFGELHVDAPLNTMSSSTQSVVMAGKGLYSSGGCSLTHGAYTTGTGASRTYNFCQLQDLPNSWDYENIAGSNTYDGSFIRETTLGIKTPDGAGFLTLNSIEGNLRALLKGNSTTMHPYYYYVEGTILGVKRNGGNAGVWEVKALFRGSGTDTCTLINSSMVAVFPPTFISSNTVPTVTASAVGDNPEGRPAILARSLEADPVWWYANLRIQALRHGTISA